MMCATHVENVARLVYVMQLDDKPSKKQKGPTIEEQVSDAIHYHFKHLSSMDLDGNRAPHPETKQMLTPRQLIHADKMAKDIHNFWQHWPRSTLLMM